MSNAIFSLDYYHQLFVTLNTITKINSDCKTLTQNSRIKKHIDSRCTHKKIYDNIKFQRTKSIENLITNKLCKQHKTIKKKVMINHISID